MTDLNKLRKAFDRAALAADLRNRIQGRLGKKNPDGSVSMVVSGKPHHLHVSLGPDGDQGVSIAKNMGVQRIPGLPVYMRLEYGEHVIYGLDGSTGHLDEFLGGNTSNLGAAPHNHRTGSGLEYEVEGAHLEPGRMRWSGTALTVHVNPFRYRYAGDWKYWGGGSIDLTANKPATTGEWAWVLVGVNPATNTLVAEAGTGQVYATPLTVDLVNNITFAGYIPAGAVRVRNDDTTLNSISRYHDARLWIQPWHGTEDFTGLSDTPANYTGAGSYLLAVNSGETAVEFVNALPSAIDALYARLLGRAGGQALQGGTGSGNNLVLESTSHATKGSVRVLSNLAVGGDFAAATPLHARGNVRFDGQGDTARLTMRTLGTAVEQSWLLFVGAADGAFGYFDGNGGVRRMALMPGGNLSLGSGDPATSARLDIQGTTGALLLPRLTTTQRDALTATFGMVIANVTTSTIQAYNGTSWVNL